MLLWCATVSAVEPYHHAVKAKKGDGIFSLLRRYHLNDHACNRSQFLELNKLSIKDNLISGKKYKLPVLIYEYNGKSIRSTIGIDSYDQAVRIKNYNEDILKDNLRRYNFIDSKILWVPFHELNCAEEEPLTNANPTSEIIKKELVTAPTKKADKPNSPTSSANTQYLKEPLFGKTNEKVAIASKRLNNEVYYIVSGHGGLDPGAMCNDCPKTLCEDEYAYDVSLRLMRALKSHGATVYMIIQDENDGIREEEYLKCDRDERCDGKKLPRKPQPRLVQRASYINSLYRKHKKKGAKKQNAIMIHVDSYDDNSKRVDTYFMHHKTSKSSKKLAQSLQNTFEKKYAQHRKGRGYKGFVKERGLFMLNYTQPTSVYVELANIRNKKDRQRLIKPRNRELLALWLFEGLTGIKAD